MIGAQPFPTSPSSTPRPLPRLDVAAVAVLVMFAPVLAVAELRRRYRKRLR